MTPELLTFNFPVRKYGAGGGIRTRDPNLGKVVLYQLSYTRMNNNTAPFKPCKYNKVVYPCQQKIVPNLLNLLTGYSDCGNL